MSTTTEYDTNNQFDWSERTTEEYSQGNVQIKNVTTLNDNGSVTLSKYENGVLQYTAIQDVADTFDWTIKLTQYEDGEVSFIGTKYDDGDTALQLYENQQLVTRVVHDENNSDPWAFKVTTYDDGSCETTTYDSLSELPEHLANYFQPQYVSAGVM